MLVGLADRYRNPSLLECPLCALDELLLCQHRSPPDGGPLGVRGLGTVLLVQGGVDHLDA